MDGPTCMKILQYLPITMLYLGFKRFFDISMHIDAMNFFVKGVRKWPRADCSKMSRESQTKIDIFPVFRLFRICGRACVRKKVREYDFRPFFKFLKGRDNLTSNCNVGSKPLKEFSDRCMLKGIASISSEENVSKFDTT